MKPTLAESLKELEWKEQLDRSLHAVVPLIAKYAIYRDRTGWLASQSFEDYIGKFDTEDASKAAVWDYHVRRISGLFSELGDALKALEWNRDEGSNSETWMATPLPGMVYRVHDWPNGQASLLVAGGDNPTLHDSLEAAKHAASQHFAGVVMGAFRERVWE